MKKLSVISNCITRSGLGLVMLFITVVPLQAQLTDYHVIPLPKTMELLSGSTNLIFGPGTFWKISDPIDLPFEFTYLDQAYHKIRVSSNGFITFDVTETYHYLTNNLAGDNPANALAPLWDYLNVGTSGKIHYANVGTAPNRVFVIEFYHIVWGPFSAPLVDFQVRLFEGSNNVEFHYGNMADAGFGADGASIGIKDGDGNFINAIDGSRDIAQNGIKKPPTTNFRFTTAALPPADFCVSGIVFKPCWYVNSPDTISVIVENRGSSDQTEFTVAYRVGETGVVRETFTSPVLSGGKKTVSFNALWEPEIPGIYSIEAWTELQGDAVVLNDTLSLTDAITVYDIELPAPVNFHCETNDQNQVVLSWAHGYFLRPLPGKWTGITSENQKVEMLLSYNSSTVDSCEVYFTIYGDPFPYPLQTHSKINIRDNKFSFYYNDQYERMSTDVDGTFFPPDSCTGKWQAGVYVNNVYTVFSGTWHASSVQSPPVLSGFQVFRNTQAGVETNESNLLATIAGPQATTYIDSEIASGIPYYYVVRAMYELGYSKPTDEVSIILTGLNDNGSLQPGPFALYPAYPNPFSTSATFTFDLPSGSFVSLKLLDNTGREVAEIFSGELNAGKHSKQWLAGNLPGGTYYYRLVAGKDTETKRIILLK